jgi:hypothetical protein
MLLRNVNPQSQTFVRKARLRIIVCKQKIIFSSYIQMLKKCFAKILQFQQKKLKKTPKKNNFRERLNIFYNIPKV